MATTEIRPFSLTGQVGIVTGALSREGIGRAMVVEAARAGAAVVYATDLIKMTSNQDLCRSLLDQCSNANPATQIVVAPLDVTSKEITTELLTEIVKKWKRFDFFFANSGYATFGTDIYKATKEDIEKAMDVMAMGPLLAIQIGSRAMAVTSPEKPEPKGSIVITTSAAALYNGGSYTDNPAYIMAKHAAAGALRGGAAQLQHTGIRVNGIAPGATRTTIAENATGEFPEELKKAIAAGFDSANTPRVKTPLAPEDQARVAIFLSAEAGQGIHGEIILVDRGLSSGPPFGLIAPAKVEPLI